jgi:hypothetical protein
MKTRQTVAFGYSVPDFSEYRLQVTTFRSMALDDYVAHTLTFPNKKEAVAFAKRAGMAFTC